jgi:DNA-binding IclR family transcriptional regulator
MDSLAESCALPVALSRRNGDYAQYIHVACVQPLAAETFQGTKLPLSTTAAGQVLLADQPEGEVRRLMHRLNAEARQTADIVRIPELMIRLAEVRQRGHSFITNRVEAAIALRLPPDPENPSLALVLVGNHASLAHRVPALLSQMREAVVRRLGPLHRMTADFAVPAEFALTRHRQVAQYPIR